MTASGSGFTTEYDRRPKQVPELRAKLKRYLQDKARAFDSQKRNMDAISLQSAFKQSLFQATSDIFKQKPDTTHLAATGATDAQEFEANCEAPQAKAV